MWTCPKCERNFKSKNQSHYCTQIDMDTLFEGKPEGLLLAFDELLVGVAGWEPLSVGVAKHAIVFASQKAWLIVKPMSKELDVKFYFDQKLESELLHSIKMWGKKYAHHLRFKQPEQVTAEVFQLLRKGFEFSLK
ncbi:MAG: DUF5655 domain-containing protein [Bacteroidota bacterium]